MMARLASSSPLVLVLTLILLVPVVIHGKGLLQKGSKGHTI
jgi:hypothetical protein